MTFLYTISIILATSLFTAFFSFWRYRSERWWELKVKTYSSIMESLHYIKKKADLDYNLYSEALSAPPHHEGDTEYNEITFKNGNNPTAIALLKQRADSSLEEVQKTIDVASFIIKQEALDELINLKTEYEQALDYDELEELYDQAKNDKKTINTCLSKIRAIAKNEFETIPDALLDKLKDWIKKRKLNPTSKH